LRPYRFVEAAGATEPIGSVLAIASNAASVIAMRPITGLGSPTWWETLGACRRGLEGRLSLGLRSFPRPLL